MKRLPIWSWAMAGVLALAPVSVATAQAGRKIACGVDLNFHSKTLRGKQRQALAAVKHLGAGWVRLGFGLSWSVVERQPGRWNFRGADKVIAALGKNKLHLLAELGGTPRWASQHPSGGRYWDCPPRDPRLFAQYAGAVARHFGSRVMVYKIYNEPNLHLGWTTHNYAHLFVLASRAIHQANPKAIVMAGGFWFAPRAVRFEEKLFTDRQYPIGRYLNALNLHMSRTSVRSTAQWLRKAEAFERRNSLHVPIWVDEFTYPSASAQQYIPGLKNGAAAQEKYFQQVLRIYAGDSKVQAVFCTCLVDNAGARNAFERSLGIMTAHFQPKPAFAVYQRFIRQHGG